MKRYYRVRFILAASLSFLAVLVLAVAGIWLFSYVRMERDTDAFIGEMLDADSPGEEPSSMPAPPPMFGYTPGPRRYVTGFYDITAAADGEILSAAQRGIAEEAGDEVREAVRRAVVSKASSGKTGPYKYGIRFAGDGTARAILLDISIQLQSLYDTLRSALTVGAALLAVLLAVLFPVSGRVANAFVRNAENQKRFITDAGHDLKTPVAIIRSNLDVMDLLQGKSKWSENVRSQTERLEELNKTAARRMAVLDPVKVVIDNFGETRDVELPNNPLDESAGTRSRGPVDLSALVREEAKSFLPAAEEKDLSRSADLPDCLSAVGDESSLRKLVDLLIDNAVRYAQPGGAVTLSGSREKRKVRLEILNTVDALPDVPPEELTGRFVRGSAARTQVSGGSGIGLSAVYTVLCLAQLTLFIYAHDEHAYHIAVIGIQLVFIDDLAFLKLPGCILSLI